MKEEFNHKHYNYKWTKGFLLALCMTLLLLSAAVFAQNSPNTPSGYSIDSVTGNLILNGSVTSATGWSSTTGGPNWTPNGAPLGSFDPADGYTFSYIPESLGQAGISLSNFNHGYLNSNAVFVTGFSYGLTYRFPCANSIGTNCDGTSQTAAPANPIQDNLRVDVGYYPSTGSPTFYVHQLGLKNINDGNPAYNPNWQTLAETITFAGAKPLTQAGSVNFEIIGSDAGGWACLNGQCYGPQVKNAYIRANYSVDPCILNTAFSPNCPGFNNVIQGVQSPVYWHSYNIAQRLPHIGGGVQLHGFDYGFNWSNFGSCYNTFLFWCTDWRTDGGGTVNFRVTDSANNILYSDSRYREGNNASGSYSNRFLFTETRNSLDMGNVSWWVSGSWNNFSAAGWTRPIWTPDPCYFNGLYSPNCTNFKETLTEVIADIKAQQEKIAALNSSSTSVTPTGSVTVTLNDVNSTNPSVTVTTNNETTQQNNRSGVSQAQTLVATEIPAVVTRNANQNARSLSLAQRAIVEANQTASSSVKEAESIADISVQTSIASSMGMQENEQTSTVNVQVNRINQMNITSSIAQSFTQSTQQVATTNREELPIQATSATPITIESAAQILMPNAMFKSVELAVALPNLPPVNPTRVQEEKQEQSFTFSSQEQPSVFVQPVAPPDIQQAYAPPSITTIPLQAPTNVIESPIQVLSQPVAPVAVTEAEQPQQQRNFTTDKTNPINDIIDSKPVVAEQRTETNLAAVNRNAQNNEVAGGVDINNIAVIPVGFNAYNVALRDAAFYAPKEIYRNQKTVDNVRALRSLASDRLHQEMVDQQYRR